MSASSILIAALLLAAAWHVVATLLIYGALDRRGRNPSFLLLRLHAPRYAGEYRKLTCAETGRTGPLFLHWVVSINVALVAGVAALLLHAL